MRLVAKVNRYGRKPLDLIIGSELCMLTVYAQIFSLNFPGYEVMSWLISAQSNVAATINHRLSDIQGFCRYLYKKNGIALDEYEAIREINDASDERFAGTTLI